jgi:hypothetical protein
VLGFRGDVVSAEVKDQRILLKIKVNPKWGLPDQDKGSYLKEWILTKVKSVFEVISISE